MEAMAVEFTDRSRKLPNFDELILAHVNKMLARVCRWPPHIDRDNARIMSQTCLLYTSRLHFGLGAATTVDKLIVHWPSGREQTLENLTVDLSLIHI